MKYFNCASLFVLSQNYIYFGNNQSPLIYIYDKTSFSRISSYRLSGRGGITDMAMFASDMQPSAASKYRSYTQWAIKWYQFSFYDNFGKYTFVDRFYRVIRARYCYGKLSVRPSVRLLVM